MKDRVLNLYFRKETIAHTGDYFYFPSRAMDAPSSNLSIPSVDFGTSMDLLRDSMRQGFQKHGAHSEILRAEANRCFYWVFWPLFRDARVLLAFIRHHGFMEVIVHGQLAPQYSALTNKGDEARPFLYFPEFVYPNWLVVLLEGVGRVRMKPPFWRSLLFRLVWWWRNVAVLLGKIALMTWMRMRFLLSRTLAPQCDVGLDYVLLARGHVSLEAFRRLGRLLQNAKKRAVIFLDPMLRQAFGRDGQPGPTETVPIIHAGSYSDFALIFASLRFLWSRPAPGRVVITDGTHAIEFDFQPMIREFECGYPDAYTHREHIGRFLQSKGKPVVISTELISEYVPFEMAAAQSAGSRYLTLQAFSCTASDAVDLVVGDGLVVQAESLRNDIARLFPAVAARVWYVGDLGYREKSQVSGRLDRIVYFSQPYDFEDQRQILHKLREAVAAVGLKSEIIVKLHPRDDRRNYSDITSLAIVESSAMANEELILGADLVVSRCSSVLHDVLMLGVPYIACTFTQYEREFSPPYLANELDVRALDMETFVRRVRGFADYQRQFAARRQTQLATIGKPFDLHAFCAL